MRTAVLAAVTMLLVGACAGTVERSPGQMSGMDMYQQLCSS